MAEPHLATHDIDATEAARLERQASILRGLQNVRAERETANRNEADLVGWARSERISWPTIAKALGVTPKQARDAEIRRQAR